MATDQNTKVSKAVFDPSRNDHDNSDQRTLYGQVLRFPSLPPAHMVFEGVTVFDTSTKDFYECQHIVTETADYYEWVAVTFGAARVFLVPVGKLTENDISDYTDKSAIDCVAKTINEIIAGLHRYGKHFDYLGYRTVHVGEVLDPNKDYYGYKNNDLIDIVGNELNKIYTGEVRLLDPSEYVVSVPVEEDYKYFLKSDEPDMTDCVNRLNEIIALLNKHFADIPLIDIRETEYDAIAHVLNLVVEEVNPFAVPWQVVIYRIWHLEQKVGNGTFVPNLDESPVDFPSWLAYKWLNYDSDEFGELKGATVCQINDTIFKLIASMDGQIGDLITFLSEETTKYRPGNPFINLVDYLKFVVAQIPEIRAKLELTLEGIRQLRNSLGNLGYIVSTHITFSSDTEYYSWNNENAKMDKLTRGTDYNTGDNVEDWCTAHDVTHIYTWSSNDTAEQLIKHNAAEIAKNRADIAAINAILGTELGDKFYIETISVPVVIDGVEQPVFKCEVGSDEGYGANKNTVFEEIDIYDQSGVLRPYEDLYKEYGPLFVLGTPKVVTKIVEMNNREIAALNRRISKRVTDIEENMNVRAEALKELTGVEGNTKEVESWHVDGYKKVVLPCSTRSVFFEAYTRYYKKVEVADGEEYENHFITKPKATLDKVFKEGKTYYTPIRGSVHEPDYNEPIGFRELVPGTDYQIGDSIVPGEFGDFIMELQETYTNTKPFLFVELKEGTAAQVEAGEADYCLPNYVLTADTVFQSDKEYFIRNVAGNYIKATGGTWEEYQAGTVSYWINSYYRTSDKTFQEDKEYYSYVEDTGEYALLEAGVDYQIGVTITGEIYEYGTQTVPPNSFYEYVVPESSIINRYSNVWVRDRQWKEYNTHRGLIDRNTDDIARCLKNCGLFQDWTKGQVAAIKDFIMYMMLATLDIVTQENSTFSILHNTTAKLVTILNAIAKLEGKVTYKHADGVYDAAYDYYRAIGFDLTTDTTFVPGKTYFVLDGTTFREATVEKYAPIPENKYYEAVEFHKLVQEVDYSIGLEVSPRIFTVDLVMPTVENYTMTEIKDAVNRILRNYMADPNLPVYTPLPVDQPIQENIVYYRNVDEAWERIVPEEDDPDMIGQLIKEYDPEHVWYIKLDEEIPDDGYTMTWIRVLMNEMIRLHNRGAETFNNAFQNFIAS